MATYREALQHARAGGTVTSGAKKIRFLTFEEAEPIILEQMPSRATRLNPETGKAIVKNGKVVVDEFADTGVRTSRLGLYDVSVSPPVSFRPTAEDIASSWVREGVDDAATPVAPEAVDEALVEHEAPIE